MRVDLSLLLFLSPTNRGCCVFPPTAHRTSTPSWSPQGGQGGYSNLLHGTHTPCLTQHLLPSWTTLKIFCTSGNLRCCMPPPSHTTSAHHSVTCAALVNSQRDSMSVAFLFHKNHSRSVNSPVSPTCRRHN